MDCPSGSSAGAIRSKRVDYYDKLDGSHAAVPAAMLSRLAARSSLTPDSAKLILVMVGLPARGKSFISHKLLDFLRWSGNKTEIFNAGQNRRSQGEGDAADASAAAAAGAATSGCGCGGARGSASAVGSDAGGSPALSSARATEDEPLKLQKCISGGLPEEHARATFFDPSNDYAKERREKVNPPPYPRPPIPDPNPTRILTLPPPITPPLPPPLPPPLRPPLPPPLPPLKGCDGDAGRAARVVVEGGRDWDL